MRELDGGVERAVRLLLRCAGAGPRYTSYPTAPVWSERYGPDELRTDLARIPARAPLALYAHVPFCRSLCHFCACNRVITKRPEPPARYLDGVEREIAIVRSALEEPGPVLQLHLGGGTPTHLSPQQIARLLHAMTQAFPLDPAAEVSVEVDPRVTDGAHLEALRACGVGRLSLGVQDFDPRVQAAIHRVQSVAQTAALVESARALGFGSIGFDLIYGLPFQSVASIERTLDAVVAIRPDRIALYAYAHVTWVARQQRGFERGDLPDPETRVRIQLAAIRRLLGAGYEHVGLDHFARPEDELARARRERTLRRNFMGYTTHAGLDLLGFGPSAISELSRSYAQSHRDLPDWEGRVLAGRLATLRGHALTEDDLERRFVIGELMCHGAVRARDFQARFGASLARRFPAELASLEPMATDGLVTLGADGDVTVSPLGRLVVRNVAMAFDAYLPAQRAAERPLFSQTV